MLIFFFFLAGLTIAAHPLHHDLGLGKLVAEAELARHVAGSVEVHLQPICAQARLQHSAALLVLTSGSKHMLGQADSVR